MKYSILISSCNNPFLTFNIFESNFKYKKCIKGKFSSLISRFIFCKGKSRDHSEVTTKKL